MNTDQVIASELALLSPAVRRDPAQVQALLDPDFVEVGASGRLWTRAELIAALAEERPAEERPAEERPAEAAREVSEFRACALSSDLVLLTYLSDHGERRSWRSSLWRLSGAQWLLRYHQGTPAAECDRGSYQASPDQPLG